MQCALVNYAVSTHTVGLLLVAGEVLDRSDNFLALRSQGSLRKQFSRQNWIFAEILEEAAAAWFPCKVCSTAQAHAESLCPQFVGDLNAVVKGQLSVPTCRERDSGWKGGARLL